MPRPPTDHRENKDSTASNEEDSLNTSKSAAKHDKEAGGMTEGHRETKESDTSNASYLVMSQLALSDRVLLNKSDLINPDEVGVPACLLACLPGSLFRL